MALANDTADKGTKAATLDKKQIEAITKQQNRYFDKQHSFITWNKELSSSNNNAEAKEGEEDKESKIQSYVPPKFQPELIDNRVSQLLDCIGKQLCDGKENEKKPLERLFQAILFPAKVNMPTAKEIINFFMSSDGNLNLYNNIIEPFFKELEGISAPSAEFDGLKWNALIAAHLSNWADEDTLALGELFYYLHHAKILQIIHNNVNSTLPKECEAKTKKKEVQYQKSIETAYNTMSSSFPSLAAQILPEECWDLEKKAFLEQKLDDIAGETPEETIEFKQSAMDLIKEVKTLMRSLADAKEKYRRELEDSVFELNNQAILLKTTIAHVNPQKEKSGSGFWPWSKK